MKDLTVTMRNLLEMYGISHTACSLNIVKMMMHGNNRKHYSVT